MKISTNYSRLLDKIEVLKREAPLGEYKREY